MMPPRLKQASTYSADVGWCAKRLAEGYPVWCVRDRATGLVASFVACEGIEAWSSFGDRPTSDYFVQRLVVSPTTGNVMFGPECAWPRAGVSP